MPLSKHKWDPVCICIGDFETIPFFFVARPLSIPHSHGYLLVTNMAVPPEIHNTCYHTIMHLQLPGCVTDTGQNSCTGARHCGLPCCSTDLSTKLQDTVCCLAIYMHQCEHQVARHCMHWFEHQLDQVARHCMLPCLMHWFEHWVNTQVSLLKTAHTVLRCLSCPYMTCTVSYVQWHVLYAHDLYSTYMTCSLCIWHVF